VCACMSARHGFESFHCMITVALKTLSSVFSFVSSLVRRLHVCFSFTSGLVSRYSQALRTSTHPILERTHLLI
jgi:hypothetical protein